MKQFKIENNVFFITCTATLRRKVGKSIRDWINKSLLVSRSKKWSFIIRSRGNKAYPWSNSHANDNRKGAVGPWWITPTNDLIHQFFSREASSLMKRCREMLKKTRRFRILFKFYISFTCFSQRRENIAYLTKEKRRKDLSREDSSHGNNND